VQSEGELIVVSFTRTEVACNASTIASETEWKPYTGWWHGTIGWQQKLHSNRLLVKTRNTSPPSPIALMTSKLQMELARLVYPVRKLPKEQRAELKAAVEKLQPAVRTQTLLISSSPPPNSPVRRRFRKLRIVRFLKHSENPLNGLHDLQTVGCENALRIGPKTSRKDDHTYNHQTLHWLIS